MDSTLQYKFKFNSDGDRLFATIDKIEKKIGKVDQKVKKFGNNFKKGIDKINKNLGTLKINAFIKNVESAAQGLESLNEPGLQLNSSMKDLSAIVDVTDQQLKNIEKSARKNAKTFGVDAADGVESYKLLLSQLSPEIANNEKALFSMGNSVGTLS